MILQFKLFVLMIYIFQNDDFDNMNDKHNQREIFRIKLTVKQNKDMFYFRN
jgi:hypothetical protein